MENTNPWLEITKQKESRPGIEGTVFEVILIPEWYRKQYKEFENLLLFGTTHPEYIVTSDNYEEDPDPNDIECADSIIGYFNNAADLLDFVDNMRIDFEMTTEQAREVWSYLKRGDGSLESLVRFLYAEHIWS